MLASPLTWTRCNADAAAAQWDGTPAAGFDAATPPQTAEGADWGAPAGGFEAAPAPAPFPDGQQQYQVQDPPPCVYS